jgi:maleate isomerase
MMSDYDSLGRIGILTPQANPTVEPEFLRIIPMDIACFTGRLHSSEKDAATRLRIYLEKMGETIAQFGNMRLDAIGFACTGSHYLIDPDTAATIQSQVQATTSAKIITAVSAIESRLHALGARSIILVSPYPNWLTAAAQVFWTARGFKIVETFRVGTVEGGTGGIYELTSRDALLAADGLAPGCADAVLITGTGLPSLPILKPLSARLQVPVISSNLCLAEALVDYLRQVKGSVA